MRDIGLPSPGKVGNGLAIRTLAARVISAVEVAAINYPGGKSPYAEQVAVFFDACAAACRKVAAPAAVAPANTAVPVITGTAKVATALTATAGTFTGTPTPTLVRSWLVGGVAVAGNATNTYTPVAGDVGKTIVHRVVATNSAGTITANSVATAAVVA